MAVLSADFVGRFTGRILNIHPSLLPAFKGLDTHQRALDAGVSQHGASVHIVTAALDDGPVILQAGLKIGEDETAETLAERVLRLEHHLLPFVLASLATGKLTLSNAVPHWVARIEIFATVDAVTRDFLEDHAIWPG
jgi:phosphoribosylglycinamide formyltransferase-1